MDNKLYQETVQRATKKKFMGKKAVHGKYKPLYPLTAEREFRRITNSYMRLLNQTLNEHLPSIMAAYKKDRWNYDSRFDDFWSVRGAIRQEVQTIAEELEQLVADFELEKKIRRIAETVKNTSFREWKRTVNKTLGVNLMNDYYKGGFYESEISKWVSSNVLKIKSLPNDTLGTIREVLLNGVRNGESIRSISDRIRDEYNITKSAARFLARDQVATLNAQITKQQHQDAGVTKYKWSTSGDDRVRDCHAELDGQIFSWDDPPEMWYETKTYGVIYTGRRCNPGEDYCCRCVAIPVFDWQTVDLPIENAEEDDEI